jgi:hypothetical protein
VSRVTALLAPIRLGVLSAVRTHLRIVQLLQHQRELGLVFDTTGQPLSSFPDIICTLNGRTVRQFRASPVSKSRDPMRSKIDTRFGAIKQRLKRVFDMGCVGTPRHDRDAARNLKPVFNHTASHASERNVANEQLFGAKLNPRWLTRLDPWIENNGGKKFVCQDTSAPYRTSAVGQVKYVDANGRGRWMKFTCS